MQRVMLLICALELHNPPLSNHPYSHEELPFYVCHASLLSEDAESHVDVTQPTEDADSVPLRMLYGALVTTPYQARGEVVFPFTDLGVRVCGIYRLKISLFRLARYASFINLYVIISITQ